MQYHASITVFWIFSRPLHHQSPRSSAPNAPVFQIHHPFLANTKRPTNCSLPSSSLHNRAGHSQPPHRPSHPCFYFTLVASPHLTPNRPLSNRGTLPPLRGRAFIEPRQRRDGRCNGGGGTVVIHEMGQGGSDTLMLG
ncbi:hypothetical protein KVT40_002755 [Elsinoe batatas]|uniref:Uncharacterized protein n=1 Tax=Elsinoe batatas TaxID=2601811 RepID=A0A8K0PE70_9PEZI|nr:hypothetical protein KVT40_002755 [Elsinoe batatas]